MTSARLAQPGLPTVRERWHFVATGANLCTCALAEVSETPEGLSKGGSYKGPDPEGFLLPPKKLGSQGRPSNGGIRDPPVQKAGSSE